MPTRMKLTDINVLELLSSQPYNELLDKFIERTFLKKEIIYTPEQEENLVFIVKSGRVRVFLSYEDKEFTLSMLEPGDIYSTHTRAFTQALGDTVILVTSVTEFKNIIATFPNFNLAIINVLGDILKNSFTIINSLVFKEAHHRLLEFLIRAAEDKGKMVSKGIKLQHGLTTEEIAMVIGSSRQTVSVLINDLVKIGVLEKLERKTLLIKDLQKLKELDSIEGT